MLKLTLPEKTGRNTSYKNLTQFLSKDKRELLILHLAKPF